jgi:hypothetical protein
MSFHRHVISSLHRQRSFYNSKWEPFSVILLLRMRRFGETEIHACGIMFQNILTSQQHAVEQLLSSISW